MPTHFRVRKKRPRKTPATKSDNDDKTKKRSYRRKNDDDDDENDYDGSTLLTQVIEDRNTAQHQKLGSGTHNKKHKKFRRSSSSSSSSNDEEEDNPNKKKKETTSILHQYQTSTTTISSKELATREAEHHPSGGSHIVPTNTTDHSISTQSSQPKRNKFLAGPLKAPTFVRTTCRFDYQPDICKDYKETGFCGYGDTCIYLHDRSDTLNGWQLEAQYEEKKKKEREEKELALERLMGRKGGDDDDDDVIAKKVEGDDEDGLPFACFLCRKGFRDPIVTICGHYFCEKCMMDKVRETGDSNCPVCQKDTQGVFNYPSKLIAKKKKVVGRDGSWEDYYERASKKGG